MLEWLKTSLTFLVNNIIVLGVLLGIGITVYIVRLLYRRYRQRRWVATISGVNIGRDTGGYAPMYQNTYINQPQFNAIYSQSQIMPNYALGRRYYNRRRCFTGGFLRRGRRFLRIRRRRRGKNR